MKKIMFRNPNNDLSERINKFWIGFSEWIKIKNVEEKYFIEEYIMYGNELYENNYVKATYKILYGKEYPFLEIANKGMDLENLKDIIQICIWKWIKPECRTEFVIEIKKLLCRYELGQYFEEIGIDRKDLSLDCTLTYSTEERNSISENNIFSDEKLLDNIERALINIQGTVRKKDNSENDINDLLRNQLRMIYDINDQGRQGISASGNEAGEVDLIIWKNKKPYVILEALILNSFKKTYFKEHIDKALYNYNPNGCPYIFVVIYSKKERFGELWIQIIEYLKKYQYSYDVEKPLEECNSDLTDYRYGSVVLRRNNKRVKLYYIAINMRHGLEEKNIEK